MSVAPTETVAVVPAVTRISGLGIGISRLPGKVTVFTTSEASISFSSAGSSRHPVCHCWGLSFCHLLLLHGPLLRFVVDELLHLFGSEHLFLQ